MDEIDVAQELEERHRSMALDAMKRAVRPQRASVAPDCEDCGAPIDARRLRALPEATRCIECQRRFEAGERWRWTGIRS